MPFGEISAAFKLGEYAIQMAKWLKGKFNKVFGKQNDPATEHTATASMLSQSSLKSGQLRQILLQVMDIEKRLDLHESIFVQRVKEGEAQVKKDRNWVTGAIRDIETSLRTSLLTSDSRDSFLLHLSFLKNEYDQLLGLTLVNANTPPGPRNNYVLSYQSQLSSIRSYLRAFKNDLNKALDSQ